MGPLLPYSGLFLWAANFMVNQIVTKFSTHTGALANVQTGQCFYSSFSLLVPCWECPWLVGSTFLKLSRIWWWRSEQKSDQGRSTTKKRGQYLLFRYASTNRDMVASHTRLKRFIFPLVSRSHTLSSESLATLSSSKPFGSTVPSSKFTLRYMRAKV